MMVVRILCSGSNLLRERQAVDPEANAATRWDALASVFRELKDVSTDILRARYSHWCASNTVARITAVDTQLSEHTGTSDEWTSFLASKRDEAVLALPATVPLSEMETNVELEETAVAENIRRYSDDFADALEHWPSIRIAAATVTQRLFG